MKIALISVRNFDPCFPISLLCLHAYLKHRQPHHAVEIIDAAFEDPLERILNGGYDLVGLGAMTGDYETATRLAKAIRAQQSVPIVLGGTHISKLPESFRDCFDVGVLGEGEEPLCQLVSLYERTRNPGPKEFAAIPGLIFRDGSALRQTAAKPLDLEDFPHLDYSVINRAYFRRIASSTFGMFGVEAFLLTSRGCPFKCAFCASSHFWGKVRYSPVQWIIDEIKSLAKRGVTLINFTDDLFACNKKRLKRIAEAIQAENLHRKITFGCSAHAAIFDEEICELLKSINVKAIFFGFESGDEQILQYLKRGKSTVWQNKAAIKLCRQYGFDCSGTLILGSPGETMEQMENSIRFVDWGKKNGAVRLGFAVLTPFPGTPVWEEAHKRGKVSHMMDFDVLRMQSKASAEGILVADDIKPQFIRLRDRAHRHTHSFKFTKARMLFRHSPWETLKFAINAPRPIMRRLLVSSQP